MSVCVTCISLLQTAIQKAQVTLAEHYSMCVALLDPQAKSTNTIRDSQYIFRDYVDLGLIKDPAQRPSAQKPSSMSYRQRCKQGNTYLYEHIHRKTYGMESCKGQGSGAAVPRKNKIDNS